MNRFKIRHLAACVLVTAIGFAAPAVASPPTPGVPPSSIEFAAGEACVFPLEVINSGSNYHEKDFVDNDGDFVRAIIAGKGSQMVVTNGLTGASITLKAYGFSAEVTFAADGTMTQVITGHVLLTLLPTDIPAGPSATLYVGRLVITIAPDGIGTVKSFTGKSTDICAALS